MVKFKNFRILLLLMSFTPLSHVVGSEIEQETETAASASTSTAKFTAKYDNYAKITYEEFFKRCAPKLTNEQRNNAIKTYKILVDAGNKPINEGNLVSRDNLGKVLSEAGYSFPPKMQLQGPFLQYCGTGDFKRVLDIGAGHGTDTILLLLTQNVQVIAVDIYEAQLNELKSNVKKHLMPSFSTQLSLFATLKRNFAHPETEAPSKYLKAFDGVNLSRVLHFLNADQTRTMIHNVATMMKAGSFLPLTVSTFVEGSKEESWINLQKSKGLDNPELVYYETVKTIRKDPLLGRLDMAQPGEVKMIDRQTCKLPDPGHKIEFMKEAAPVDRVPAIIHFLQQGRHYHNLESLKSFLDPYFNIIDHIVYHYDDEDKFLGILAERKHDL